MIENVLKIAVSESIYVKDKFADFSEKVIRKIGGLIQQLKTIVHSAIVEWLCIANRLSGPPNLAVDGQITEPPMLAFFAAIGGFIF